MSLRFLPFLLVFLLPTHLWRFSLLGWPTNFWEVLVGLTFLLTFPFWRREEKPPFPFWLILSGLFLAAGLFGGLILASDKLVALGIIKSWFVVPLLAAWTFYFISRRQPETLIFGLASLVLFLSVVALEQFLSGEFVTLDGRVSAFYSSANLLAMILLPAILVLLGFLAREKLASWPRLFLMVAAFLGLLALGLTFSFSALIALLVGLGFLLILRFGRRARWFSFSLFLLGLVLLGSKLGDWGVPSSVSARLQIWRVAGELIKQNPLWGIGLGDFLAAYQPLARKLFSPPLELLVPHAHNFFLESYLLLGLFGLLGFLGLIFGLIRSAYQKRSFWLPAFLALLIQGLFDTIYYHPALAAIFWLFIVLAHLPL